MFVFLLALQASGQIKATVCDFGNLRTMLWLSIILLPLLATLWILALLAVNDAIDELHYAYSFMALLSSLYIFISYCLVNRRVRHNIQQSWQRVMSSGSRSPGSDESFSGTRTSMTGSRGALYHASPGGGGQGAGSGHHQGGSSFDVYGMRTAMAMDGNVISGQVISSSSTTSRSTVTKGSGAILDGEEPVDTMDETEDTDGYRQRHRHRHHRHHKCHRRHRRGHRHHRSKQSVTATETGSSDDASYDRSLDLASSHSSDEEEDGPGQIFEASQIIRNQMNPEEMMQQQQENQINSIIAEHQKQGLYGQTGGSSGVHAVHPSATSSTLGQANSSDTSGANTVIYGQRAAMNSSGTPAILKQNPDNHNQAHLVTSMPFSRSNILAMTAGLGDAATVSSSGAAGLHHHHQPMASPSGGGNTPSPAPPLTTGISPASSIHSHIYQSANQHMNPNVSGVAPITSSSSTTEHIYSYARKPVTVLAPVHGGFQGQQTQHPASSIYSTVGPKTAPVVISDDIGLPAVVPPNAAIAYRHSGTLPHHHHHLQHRAAPTYQSVSLAAKENPYGISTHSSALQHSAAAAAVGSSSPHVRLLNPSDPDLSGGQATNAHEAVVDNNRNEANESSRVSSSRQYLLTSNTDSSNGYSFFVLFCAFYQ